MAKVKFMKSKWFPQPHSMHHSWYHRLESGSVNDATIYPILHYDEGLGTPTANESSPRNAAFVQASHPNCFVGSRVDNVFCQLSFAMAKGLYGTDNINAVRLAFMPIFLAFKDDYTAIDELSSNEIQDVLEMQTESTDRQGFPLYNTVKVFEKFSNSALLAAGVDGLTTTQVLEGVAFSSNVYYNALKFMTIAGKLKSVQGGLKWLTLTSNRPVRTVGIKLRSKTKAMNEFTFFGVLIYVPKVDTDEQIATANDTTNIDHVSVDVTTRFNEWNEDFNMKMI